MDSYYALGATSVPMRKSRLVTAIRFSMCLHYNRSWKRKQATQPKHFHIFSTISKFSQPITTFHNLFFSSILSIHLPTIRTHRSRQGKKEKVLQSNHNKKSRPVGQISLSCRSALWIFSDTFYPLTGAVAFWYTLQSMTIKDNSVETFFENRIVGIRTIQSVRRSFPLCFCDIPQREAPPAP